MIQKFVDRFMAEEKNVRAGLATAHPQSYKSLVELVIKVITSDDYRESPDPERIVEIDHGDYQGTLLYVIGSTGYQPSQYWCVFVGYGSCSGCDTLQGICGYDHEPPTEEQINDYWTLCLHIVQGLKSMNGDDAA